MTTALRPNIWAVPSPLGRDTSVVLTIERPVWFVMVRGTRDDGTFGPVGSLWMSEDEADGGFLPVPKRGWMSDEMHRSYESALERGWDPARIFRYWSESGIDHPGLELDVPIRAEELSAVRRLLDRL